MILGVRTKLNTKVTVIEIKHCQLKNILSNKNYQKGLMKP